MENSNQILQLCRLCLVKDSVNIPIFEEQGDIRQIYLKISSCLPVKVSQDDELPKKICDGCSYKLDMVYDFRNTSVNAEKQLTEWLGQANLNSESINKNKQPETTQRVKTPETFVKQEAIDPSDVQKEEEEDDKNYMFQQNFEESSAAVAAGPSATATSNEEEPPPKRAKRTAAVKASLALDQSDEDDDEDWDPITKREDESEGDSDADDNDEAPFVDVPSTSADDQPGPSGVGKDGVEAPSDEFDDALSEVEPTNIQCGMCLVVFPNKKKFQEHSTEVSGTFTCCRCQAKFKSGDALYRHYGTHKSAANIENEEEYEEIIVQQNASETNELIYVLDDSSCVNEVVIDEGQPHSTETLSKTRREAIEIVNLEHGYVMPNIGSFIEEEMEDEEGNIIITRRRIVKAKPSVTSRVAPQSKPRNPQPRRRHEVPDFSATSYLYVEPTTEIEVPHYKCLRCEQLFINKFGFFRHIEKGKCYINNCDVCTATFAKNSEFYEHYTADHTDRAICNFCFRTFMYEKNVKEHMLRHLDQFRHRCEDCNKGFYTVREYRNHYKNRHMGIRHKCEVCGRSFADEYYFKRHIATHAKAASNNITFLDASSD